MALPILPASIGLFGLETGSSDTSKEPCNLWAKTEPSIQFKTGYFFLLIVR